MNNIKQRLDANTISKKTEEKWKNTIKLLWLEFLKRWEKSSRKRDLFTKKNQPGLVRLIYYLKMRIQILRVRKKKQCVYIKSQVRQNV